MLNISEPAPVKQANSFFNSTFELAFRPYFLLASASSVIALSLWLLVLSGYVSFSTTGLSAVNWHIHEMLFGYGAAIAVGFILTAVQTWTGQASISGKPLAALVLVWCLIRLAIWLNTATTVQLAIGLQSLWWLSAIICYGRLVLVSKNKRNYLFVPLLTLLGSANVAMLWADISGNSDIALHIARSAVLLFTILMSIVGGRVIPFFTVRGANTAPITTKPLLEWGLLLSSIIAVASFISSRFVQLPYTPGTLMILVASLHLMRLGFWRTAATFSVPLLWSLHIAYLLMAIGLLLLGVSYFTTAISFSAALHLITIGGLGLMTLAMMSRVSLGHTGRALDTRKIVNWAFISMIAAAISRAVLIYWLSPVTAWTLSALLWLVAMLIFLFVYWPILTSPRQQKLPY